MHGMVGEMTRRVHSIEIDSEKCIGCVACSVVCPTEAIRVRSGLARVSHDLCIDCGGCIAACRYDAVRARMSSTSDLARFKHTVAIPSMTLYGQFGSNVDPSQVLDGLIQIGFDSTYDISWMYEMLGRATDAYLSECGGPWPKITASCPAIVRLVQIRYPDLIPHLVPLESARELAAKLHRRRLAKELGLAPDEIGFFFISPCTAIMNSIVSPVGMDRSYVDGALSISEVYGPLLKAIMSRDGKDLDAPVSARGMQWSVAGGQIGEMRNENTIAISGATDILRVFDRIESGKFQSVDLIEAHICPGGCVSGQLRIENRHAAERSIQRIVRRRDRHDRVKEERVRSLLHEHFFDLEEQIAARPVQALGGDLRTAIAMKRKRQEVLEGFPGKDCAACGAPTCEALARDVVKGEADPEDCVFVRIDRLEGGASTAGEGEDE
ncbi:MAG: 4Fe-4S dicluster domain-containing protein [Candidatus Eisenbacteria bacterium]|nr:4Fe-4S dicluster domain-containing protein [Candidatus Latescibacterota bacterium]MBD3302808.1 4Fe-4S dicluster domain-containing protein [Candidatus Eisenbacteria bacterium]